MAALLLSVIRSPFVAFDAAMYVRVAYRHLAEELVEFTGRVLQHLIGPYRPLSAAQPTGGSPPAPPSADTGQDSVATAGSMML